MSIFPKIQGPCPYKNELSKYMEGDLCRMCDRRVVDLNPLSDTERVALISGCKEKVCVSYTLRPSTAVALAAAALLVPLSVAAQDFPSEDSIIVLAGAIVDPSAVEYVSDEASATVPTIPVIYDDEPVVPSPEEGAPIPTNQAPKPQTTND